MNETNNTLFLGYLTWAQRISLFRWLFSVCFLRLITCYTDRHRVSVLCPNGFAYKMAFVKCQTSLDYPYSFQLRYTKLIEKDKMLSNPPF